MFSKSTISIDVEWFWRDSLHPLRVFARIKQLKRKEENMSSQIDAIPDFIRQKSLQEIRDDRGAYESKIAMLWAEKSKDLEWTADHPDLSLKLIALLNQEEQLKSEALQLLKVIAGKILQKEMTTQVLTGVLEDAIDRERWEFILKLIEAGISPDYVIDEKCSLLHAAVRGGHKEVCAKLIELGAEVNAVDDKERSPLHLALEQNEEDIARELIANGADVDQRDDMGVPPAYHAIVSGSDELAIEILSRMHTLNEVDTLSQTCLHMACCHARTSIALFIISEGVLLNQRDGYGNSPLHYACEKSLVDVVDRLLEKRAIPDMENHNQAYPFCLSLKEKDSAILDCFAKHLPPLEWEKLQIYQWLLLDEYDKAREIVSAWKESEAAQEILTEVIKDEVIADYLIGSFPDWVESFIASADLDEMEHDYKLLLLPLLPPDEIYRTLNEWDQYDQNEWLETEIELEETADGEMLTEPVHTGLLTINFEWIEHIQWEDNNPYSYSNQLITDTVEVLERLPVLAFAAAACSPMLRPVLIKCLTIIPPAKLNIFVPLLSEVEFVHLAENLSFEMQCNLLSAAKEEQKIAFLQNVALEYDPLIRDWLFNGHSDMYRQLEIIIDKKILSKGDYLQQAQKLVADIEDASMRLPSAVQRSALKWKRMLHALTNRSGSDQLRLLTEQLVKSKIDQIQHIPVQIDRLRRSIYEESRLGLSPPEEQEIPDEYLCGIMQTVMKDPVTSHGHSFEREAIKIWLDNNHTCPICRASVTMADFANNTELKQQIEESGIGTE